MIKKILIIEDDPADQFLNQVTFTTNRPAVEIEIAHDGQEALDLIKNKNIQADLILLDINMPRMNGLEFLEIFTDHNEKEIPVIVMLTSSDQGQDKEAALNYKCVKDYLLKPISVEKIEHLENLLETL